MVPNWRVLLLLLIPLVACQPKSKQRASIEILTLRGPSSMGLVKWIDSLQQSPDAALKIRMYNEPNQVRTQILQNRCDLAFVPMNMAAILHNKGASYQVVAVPVWGSLYLIGSDSLIQTWDNLRGKRIFSMAKGMTPDILLRYLLTVNGLIPDQDVILDYSFPNHLDLVHATLAGRTSFSIISEPFVAQIIEENPNIHPVFDLNQAWIESNAASWSIPQTALVVKESFASDHPEKLQEILNEIQKSFQFTVDSSTIAATMMVRNGIMNDPVAAKNAIPSSHLKYCPARDVEKTIFHYLKILNQFNPNCIGGKIPDEKFIY